jgi:flavodoxin I
MRATIIYWSGTGNTAAMASAIAKGLQAAGAETALMEVSSAQGDAVENAELLVFGCPAMGAEVLEESEFEPFFQAVEGKLSGKKVALFGSYGWGDGQWMRDWEARVSRAGAHLLQGEGLILQETPDSAGLERCTAFGQALAAG